MNYSRLSLPTLLAVALVAAGCSSDKTPTAPTPPNADVATVRSVTVSGTQAFNANGAGAQLSAVATMSDGSRQDWTTSATWASDNDGIVRVNNVGFITTVSGGAANVTATVSGVRGTLPITVSTAPTPVPGQVIRTPDPPAGQRIPLPDYLQSFVNQLNAARPDLYRTQSCPRGLKYVNNPWQDYIIDNLRTRDTRWGYNGKPTRTAADNGGVAVVAAGDEVAYHYSGGADLNSTEVYLIDLLEGHCGSNPLPTYRNFTGEEPGRWATAGRF